LDILEVETLPKSPDLRTDHCSRAFVNLALEHLRGLGLQADTYTLRLGDLKDSRFKDGTYIPGRFLVDRLAEQALQISWAVAKLPEELQQETGSPQWGMVFRFGSK
jgi:hypothetical protein